jgi:adenine deaminase
LAGAVIRKAPDFNILASMQTMIRKTITDIKSLVEVAAGRKNPSLLLHDIDIFDVFTGLLWKGNIWVSDVWIAYVGEKLPQTDKNTMIVDGKGKVAVPGYIDAHGHADLFYNPSAFADYVITRGATTVFSDSHDMINSIGISSFMRVRESAATFPVKFLWGVPATYPPYPDIEGGQLYPPHELIGLMERCDDCVSLSEVAPYMRILEGENRIIETIHAAVLHGKNVEGHTLGASFDRLNVLAAAGITSCHESIRERDVLNRIRLGFATMVRHSSIRSDLETLAPLINDLPNDLIILVSDGIFADDLIEKGYMDYVIASAIRFGIKPESAIRMATLNPARYFGLDRAIGSLTPGRIADILVLDAIDAPTPKTVIERGKVVTELCGVIQTDRAFPYADTGSLFAFTKVETDEFRVPDKGLCTIPVIDILDRTVTGRADLNLQSKNGMLLPDKERNVQKIFYTRRERKQWGKGFVRGAGARIGAIASSVAHEMHGLLVLGYDEADMALAANRVLDMNGGIAVADNGNIISELNLPYGGTMSALSIGGLAGKLNDINLVLKERGSLSDNPLWTIVFLTFTSIVDLRITVSGIYDVRKREIIF